MRWATTIRDELADYYGAIVRPDIGIGDHRKALVSTMDIFPTLLDVADPGQMHGQQDSYGWSNLAGKPECADVRDRLMQAIGDRRESTPNPLLDSADFKKTESKVNGSS